MASRRGVQDFVRNKNEGRDGPLQSAIRAPAGTYEDLKMETGRSQPASKHGPATSQRHENNFPVKREPQEERRFYDTDASVTATSTASPTQLVGAVNQNGRLDGCEQHGDDSESEEGSDSGESEEESGHELPVNLLEGEITLNSRQRKRMLAEDAARLHFRGEDLPYMQGDSYPDTTDGVPSPTTSVAAEHQRNSPNRKVHIGAGRQAHGSRPSQSHTSSLPARPGHTSHPQSIPRDQLREFATWQNGPVPRPDTTMSRALQHEHSNGLRHTVPDLPPPFGKPPPHYKGGAAPQTMAKQTPASDNTATRASMPTANGSKSYAGSAAQHPSEQVMKNTATQPMNPLSGTKAEQTAQETAVKEEPTPTFAPEGRASVPQTIPVSSTSPRSEQMEDPEEAPLDYDEATLFRKSFHDLRSESFDTDPNAAPFTLPNQAEDGDLEAALKQVAKLPPEQQVKFFASLSLDDWEQAGECFVSGFGDVLSKLKVIRREKRAAARLFEDEIEKRYTTVDKKRKQTEAELDEMKKSGGKVLQGTPKRARAR